MSQNDIKKTEAQRQALLEQLKIAEAAVRNAMHAPGFGSTPIAHMERALAHIQEAYIALNEINRARTVAQLVNDLVRIEQFLNDATRGKSQRI